MDCIDKIEELLKAEGITPEYANELKTVAARADDFSLEVPFPFSTPLSLLNFSFLFGIFIL